MRQDPCFIFVFFRIIVLGLFTKHEIADCEIFVQKGVPFWYKPLDKSTKIHNNVGEKVCYMQGLGALCAGVLRFGMLKYMVSGLIVTRKIKTNFNFQKLLKIV